MKKILSILISLILVCSIGTITQRGRANSLEIEAPDFIPSANQWYLSADGDRYGDEVSVCDVGAFEENSTDENIYNYLPLVSKPCPFLYFDNFSDPTSGWPIIETGDALQEYKEGEYRIVVHLNVGFVAVRSSFIAVDYRVSVDLRNVTGAYGAYGIIFVAKPDGSGWYSLEIFPDGYFGIYRYDQYGDQYGWVMLEEAYSPAIRQGIQSNNISVERNGSSITAYANDQYLISIYDSYLMGEGYLGLINYSYIQPDVDIRYDNFKVIPAGCADQQTLSETTLWGKPGWIAQPNVSSNLQNSVLKHQP